MTRLLWICLALLLLGGCAAKDSDVDLFDEGRLEINLSADPRKGTQPVHAYLTAYLETRERTVLKEIKAVKWIIRGPQRFYREIKNESYNFQEEEMNQNDFFHLEYDFFEPGVYNVRLVLNDGEFSSKPVKITVYENPDPSYRRPY